MRGGKRGVGWYEMERQYRHNRIPEPPPVTGWDKVLVTLNLTEEEALLVIASPRTKEAKKLRDGLMEGGAYRYRYVPEVVLEAFGLNAEVEARIAGEWANARGPRKPKEKVRG